MHKAKGCGAITHLQRARWF